MAFNETSNFGSQRRMAGDRRFLIVLMSVVALAFFLRVLWLSSQPVSGDDFAVGLSAVNYMENGQLGPTMWNHPGLRNILIYYSMKVFGSGVIGLKGWSVLFGTLSTLLIGLVLRKISGNAHAALLASFLWAIDLLAVDFSRQAINDVYLAFFPLLGIYLSCRFLDARSPYWMLAAGVAFGFGLASKWSAVFQIAATVLLLVYHAFKGGRLTAQEFLPRLSLIISSLVLLPLLVYVLTFLPWFQRGYSFSEWTLLQKSMYMETAHHTRYGKPITGDIRPSDWFIRPVTYEDAFYIASNEGEPEREPTIDENVVFLYVIANPLVWLLVLPAMLFVLYRGIKKRDDGLLYLATLFLFSYLPLALAQRPIWLNTALAVLPYALMATAYMLYNIFREERTRRRFLTGYLAAAALTALTLYPLAIGKGLRIPYVRELLLAQYERSQSGIGAEKYQHPGEK